MATVTLAYTNKSGTSYSKAYASVRTVRGLDRADEWENYGLQQKSLDGDVTETFLGFRRIFTVDLGVISDADERAFIAHFLIAPTKSITYSNATYNVVLVDPSKFANEWMESTHLGRRFILHLAEQNIRVTLPTAGVAGEVAYIKNKVQIAGTQASPETLTTNAGKLTTDQTGASYPNFNDSTHVFTALCNSAPYQEAMVNIIAAPTIPSSPGAMTFQVAVSDYGKAASDGNYYADIVIIIQTIV